MPVGSDMYQVRSVWNIGENWLDSPDIVRMPAILKTTKTWFGAIQITALEQ